MKNPYLLLPVGILTILIYFVSHILMRFGIISLSGHRKIWNVILLLTFLVTAVLGIILVIEINYKLQWTVVDNILKWHVNTGIAMSIIAIFHFIWHWPYYMRLFKKDKKVPSSQTETDEASVIPTQGLTRLVFTSGFVSIVSQVLLLREITTVFQGNELYMTWTIGLWMLLTGLGVFIASHSRKPVVGKILLNALIMLALLPILSVLALSLVKNTLFLTGALISPLSFLVVAGLLLLPVCFINGFIFSSLIGLQGKGETNFVKVYAFEAIGSMAGGLLVSLLLVRWFGILQSMIAVLSVDLIVIASFKVKKTYLLIAGISIACFIAGLFIPVDSYLKSFLFRNQKIVKTEETYYGNITVCESAGQYSFFDNGSLLFTSDNVMNSEEYVHYAMQQVKKPHDVLLVSGGVSGMLAEILKYPTVKHIDYIELNPELIRLAKKYLKLPENLKINYLNGDGRKFILKTVQKYDVIILAIPDPISLEYNRYYTQEFYAAIKKIIAKNGVVIIGLSSLGDYVNQDKIEIESSVYTTLCDEFNNVRLVPGGKDFFLASDSVLNTNIAEMMSRSNIETNYVNQYYIDDFIIKQRQNFVLSNLDSTAILNSDIKPVPVFYHSLLFLSRFQSKWRIYLGVLAVLLFLPVFFFGKTATTMFSAGFTASALEMMLVFTFQIFYGYVYSAIGLIIAVFMGGLAIGSIIGKKVTKIKNSYIVVQLIFLLITLCYPLVWFAHKDFLNQFITLTVFYVYIILISLATGLLYVICTRAGTDDTRKSARYIYAADLTGSSLGVIFISVILIPVIGLINSSIALAAFNGFVVLKNLVFKK